MLRRDIFKVAQDNKDSVFFFCLFFNVRGRDVNHCAQLVRQLGKYIVYKYSNRITFKNKYER